jgi:small GTP-binding protein
MHGLDPVPSFKVVLLGDSGVGKTSIVQYFERQAFDAALDSTVGASFMSREMTTPHGTINLHVWDTAGQERYRSLVPTYARGACTALIVFDLSIAETFQSVQRWLQELRNFGGDSPFVYVVGNKADLVPTVPESEAAGWATGAGLTFFCVSAKTGHGVPQLFQAVADEIAAKRPAPVHQFSPPLPEREPDAESPEKAACC